MWSKELQEITREFFQTSPAGIVKRDEPFFSALAIIKGDGTIVVSELEGDQVWRYESVSTMIDDGWGVD